jgi:methyl-accepting chemotaxis protein
MLTWYKNQKISKKLIIGFLIVALLAAIVGIVGVINIININNEDTELYEDNALGLQYGGKAAESFQRLRYRSVMLAVQETSDEKETYKTKITEASAAIDTALEDYKSTISDEDNEVIYKILSATGLSTDPLLMNLLSLPIMEVRRI